MNDQEEEVTRRVHAVARSFSDNHTKRNTVFFKAGFRRVREEVATHVCLEKQDKTEQIVATRVNEAKDLLRCEVQTDLEEEIKHTLNEELNR